MITGLSTVWRKQFINLESLKKKKLACSLVITEMVSVVSRHAVKFNPQSRQVNFTPAE